MRGSLPVRGLWPAQPPQHPRISQNAPESDKMTVEHGAAGPLERAADLLKEGAEAELRLLKRERKAERRLAEARATLAEDEKRLERARKRVASSAAAVAKAETRLSEAQAARAAGPRPAQD